MGRPVGEEHAIGAEAADRELGGDAAVGEPEVIVGAARDGVVALPRIERPLDHAQRLNQLGDDEVGVGVAVAVQVARLVDRHAVDGELDVLSFARVEAAQEHLLGVALAAFVGEQDARRELEELGGVGARHERELPDVDVVVGGAAARRLARPATLDS